MRSYSMRSHPTRGSFLFLLTQSKTHSFTNRQKHCQSQEYGQCSYSSVPMIFSGFGKVHLSHQPDDRPPSAIMLAMIICDCSHFRPDLRRGGQSSSQSWMLMTFPLSPDLSSRWQGVIWKIVLRFDEQQSQYPDASGRGIFSVWNPFGQSDDVKTTSF
jgi:hypothetical protein